MEDLVKTLSGLRSEVPDRVLMDLVDLHALAGDELPVRIQMEELQLLWGVTYQMVSTRMSQLRKLGLVRYDRGSRGSPGYEVWSLGPGPQPRATM